MTVGSGGCTISNDSITKTMNKVVTVTGNPVINVTLTTANYKASSENVAHYYHNGYLKVENDDNKTIGISPINVLIQGISSQNWYVNPYYINKNIPCTINISLNGLKSGSKIKMLLVSNYIRQDSGAYRIPFYVDATVTSINDITTTIVINKIYSTLSDGIYIGSIIDYSTNTIPILIENIIPL